MSAERRFCAGDILPQVCWNTSNTFCLEILLEQTLARKLGGRGQAIGSQSGVWGDGPQQEKCETDPL